MELEKETSTDIIDFLKEHHNLNEALFKIIEASENGVYFIDKEKLSMSNQARNLLKLKNDMTIDHFYKKINLQDRKKLLKLLNDHKNKRKPYEIIYRYHSDEEMIWIKEHGLYSDENKRVAFITNISKQIKQDELLHRLAYYDSITKLKNHNYFDKDLQFLMNYQVSFALFFMDLNSFKLINDNFGHLFGDYILKEFSNRINHQLESLYSFDFYRLSGDEFALIFPYLTKKKDTDTILENIYNLFDEPFKHEDYQISITPSIGITFYPKDTQNKTKLLQYADISMYHAKNEPFLNYCYFEKKYYHNLLEEKRVENHIESLINEREITLRYQPIYHATTNEVVCLEALFTDELQELQQIFNIALKSHLIVLLEKKIIEKVMYDIKTYDDIIPSHIRFTINLTPKTAEYLDIYSLIKEYMQKYSIDGSRIGIEITEQYYIKDEDKLNTLIKQLNLLGIKVYLDDFGMGFSSVRNLTYLTYDHIKLDKHIIQNIFKEKKCLLFLKSIFQFSQEMGCDIITEGIESKEQYDYLKALGGCYFQGYYLSKPLNIKQIIQLIQANKDIESVI